jgi:hypothetical protein
MGKEPTLHGKEELSSVTYLYDKYILGADNNQMFQLRTVFIPNFYLPSLPPWSNSPY